VAKGVSEIDPACPTGHDAVDALTRIQLRTRLATGARTGPAGTRSPGTTSAGDDPHSRTASSFLRSAGKIDIIPDGEPLLVRIVGHGQDRQLLPLVETVQCSAS